MEPCHAGLVRAAVARVATQQVLGEHGRRLRLAAKCDRDREQWDAVGLWQRPHGIAAERRQREEERGDVMPVLDEAEDVKLKVAVENFEEAERDDR